MGYLKNENNIAIIHRDSQRERTPHMIIVRLMGGLGNQLFQYAAGRNVALKNDLPLKLDLSWFKDQPDRPYSLHHFAIIEGIATPNEIAHLKKSKMNLLDRIITTYKECGKPYYHRTDIREKSLDFDKNILQISGSAYLEGYWQSEKYFKDIEDIIRKEFSVITPPDHMNSEYARMIPSLNAVAIHVRRGDYISNQNANKFHGICSLDYYHRSIDQITSTVENPHFFVFSDDPEWTQDNLKIDAPTTYVVHNPPDKNYEDLRLMSLCSHFIIANSSFSWWGAWLSKNESKIVIAPSTWFQGIKYNCDDRLPEGWICLV